MPNKMLIDASHPEETRVVVVRGNRIEEFDFESQDKKQLKGNIYLARVTRVEPSLQAAFVEYGGNRHGFLAFSEIHPDYYQIPVADRQELLRAEAEAAQADDDEDEERGNKGRRRRRSGGKGRGKNRDQDEQHADDASGSANGDDDHSDDDDDIAENGDTSRSEVMAESVETDSVSEDARPRRSSDKANGSNGEDSDVESVGAEDAIEEARDRRRPVRRNYKIQEVIKRRQILLVQVVKEERGNKGAALTTYLSLAGRYSVLMPNTARGGGISRKITNAQDRKRLKDVVRELEVPEGMGVILRTAGESRTKAEIKRDYEYLMRLWENVRNLTLQSSAPALVYEEGSLIKRSVRDLYNKDINEILVAGDEGYREAKDFMRMLMPSHAKSVQPYRDTIPILARNGIEAQLDRMLQPQVTLKSGGYIIINQTEALVAIDVNSGRSTREHSIEDTALQTNLEASDEIARQLRLRDLAGLVVIDYIDMEENRNNRAVEKRLKDCLKNDRARIQVGRISHFGLLEMSRQRIRASVLESTMQVCVHCAGTGHIRSESSVALMVIRAIEEFLLKDSRNHITVRTPSSTALYVLNHKRNSLADFEARFGLTVTVEADETVGAQHYVISKGEIAEKPEGLSEIPVIEQPAADFDEDEDEAPEEVADSGNDNAPSHENSGDNSGDNGSRDRKRRRRRRRRGGRDRDQSGAETNYVENAASDLGEPPAAPVTTDGTVDGAAEAEVEGGSSDTSGKRRRRGKRGGRRNKREDGDAVANDGNEQPAGEPDAAAASAEAVDAAVSSKPDAPVTKTDAEPAAADSDAAPEKPTRAKKAAAPRRSRKKVIDAETEPARGNGAVTAEPAQDAPAETPPEAKPVKRRATRKKTPEKAEAETAVASSDTAEPIVQSNEPQPAQEERPRKSGWWQRKGFF